MSSWVSFGRADLTFATCSATYNTLICERQLPGNTARKQRSVFQAVQVMTKICAESERSLDYYGLFKQIMKRAPVPMSPLESLASSAVRTAHKVCCVLCCALPTRYVASSAVPMSPLASLASSAVRTAHSVCVLHTDTR